MIKNKIILTLIIGSLFSPLFVVNAIENTKKPTTTPTPPIAEIKKEKVNSPITNEQQQINNLREMSDVVLNKKIDERKNEKKKVLNADSKDRILKVLNIIYKNFDESIKKIEEIDSKISAKIEILKKEGKDVTAVQKQYDIAKFELTKTKIDILTASTLSVKQIMTSTSKGILRDLVKETENTIKNVGEEYRKMLPMFAQLEGDNSIKN